MLQEKGWKESPNFVFAQNEKHSSALQKQYFYSKQVYLKEKQFFNKEVNTWIKCWRQFFEMMQLLERFQKRARLQLLKARNQTE